MASRPVLPREFSHNGRKEWGTYWFDDAKKRRWKYFGECSAKIARARFAAFVQDWDRHEHVRNPESTLATYTRQQLAVDYLEYAKRTFTKNGKPTTHVWEVAYAMQALIDHGGQLGASSLNSPELAKLRDLMVKGERAGVEYARSIRTVNGRLSAIKAAYGWAREQGLVTAECLLDVRSVRGLTSRCPDAAPTEPVRPIDEHYVAITKEYAPKVVADMIELQWLTGMRPGEVCAMRPCEIDRSGDVWVYSPPGHKMAHKQQPRFICFGSRAQALLVSYLESRPPAAFVFSAKVAHAQRLEAKRLARKTKLWPSHTSRDIANPTGRLADFYTQSTYRKAVKYACEKAIAAGVDGLPIWTPNQLRHSWATRVRATFGIEAAGAGLGHSSLDTTLIYAEQSLETARRVARKVG